MTIAIITGSITPYTSRLYDAYAQTYRQRLHVLTCVGIEPHRRWTVPPPVHFALEVLPGLHWHVNDVSHVYVNPSVLTRLARLRPEVMVLASFTPTMGLAALYARITGTPYGVATDGALSTDPGETSLPHRLMRRAIVPRARFGICASDASVELLVRWGLDPARGVVVPIVTPWNAPERVGDLAARPYDVIFAGGVNERYKGALFFADVVERCKARGRPLKVRVTGEGPQRAELAARLQSAGIEAHFDGALQPDRMAEALGSARIMMFPSRHDPWGLVANEAVLCGTPVLGSPHAVSSPMFVERFGVGLVRPLEVEAWSDAVLDMLSTAERLRGFMVRRGEAIAWFSLDRSVAAMRQAIDLGRAERSARAVVA